MPPPTPKSPELRPTAIPRMASPNQLRFLAAVVNLTPISSDLMRQKLPAAAYRSARVLEHFENFFGQRPPLCPG